MELNDCLFEQQGIEDRKPKGQVNTWKLFGIPTLSFGNSFLHKKIFLEYHVFDDETPVGTFE